ncbi:unnamed protein product [Ceratitis capitata]|uniref:(Mediterranean fruit fly) hypothetical protein n=1 Tax=Ceratitis capitata TaxID=7213 RepID=A0A811V4B2_CERCA|nr:unnamed protein product [Ceratitis capitata]
MSSPFRHVNVLHRPEKNVFIWQRLFDWPPDWTSDYRYPYVNHYMTEPLDTSIYRRPLRVRGSRIYPRVYVKIPQRLCNTAEIHKFVEPLEDFTYKKTQQHLRDAIEYYLRPRIRIALAQLWSANNWKIRLEEHKRRLFREQQRTILYKAMLRHDVFPKYPQFRDEFCGHVKHIDFFKFIIWRCYKPLTDDEETKREGVRCKEEIKQITDKPLTTVSVPENPKPAVPGGGLRLRSSMAKYRSRTPPKCETTFTHITDKVD